MIRFLFYILFQSISPCFSQLDNGGGIVDPDEQLVDFKTNAYFINKGRDTVFYFCKINDSIVSESLYLREKDNWVLNYCNGQLKEKGVFEKAKYGLFLKLRLLIFHPKYFLKKRKYFEVRKVGKWIYFSENGNIEEEAIYDKK